MTLIISKLDNNGRTLYADKRATCGGEVVFNSFNKIIKTNKLTIGFCGSASDRLIHEVASSFLVKSKKIKSVEIFKAYKSAFKELHPKDEEEDIVYCLQSLIHIKHSNDLYMVEMDDRDINVIELNEEPFVAIGSGEDHAKTLYFYNPNITIEEIYSVSSKVTNTVGSEFTEVKNYE